MKYLLKYMNHKQTFKSIFSYNIDFVGKIHSTFDSTSPHDRTTRRAFIKNSASPRPFWRRSRCFIPRSITVLCIGWGTKRIVVWGKADERNFLNFFLVPLYDFQISFLLRTGFPHVWDRMLFINSRVKAVEPCMSEKHPGTSTHESQTIWEFLPLLERNGNVLLQWTFSHTTLTLDTPSHLMILKSSALVTLSLSYFYGKVYLSPNLSLL